MKKYRGHNIFLPVMSLLSKFILILAKWTQLNYLEIARKKKVPVFLTIPYSHYVEFARFSMKLCQFEYIEYGYAPVQHVLPVLSLRFSVSRPNISKTSSVQKVHPDTSINDESKRPKSKKGGSTSVPVLALPNGIICPDSWSIVSEINKDSKLIPIDDVTLKFYDVELGPTVRQYFYIFILKESNSNVWNHLCSNNMGVLWYTLWYYLGMKYFATNIMVKVFQPKNMKANEICREKLEDIIKILDNKVISRKGEFINGDLISVEDVALASLFAPMVLPQLYCDGKYSWEFDQLYNQDQEYRDELIRMRNTETGKYVMNFYNKFR